MTTTAVAAAAAAASADDNKEIKQCTMVSYMQTYRPSKLQMKDFSRGISRQTEKISRTRDKQDHACTQLIQHVEKSVRHARATEKLMTITRCQLHTTQVNLLT